MDADAVEKVPFFCSRHDGAKIDLSECPVFDDRSLGNGKRTPDNATILRSGTFSTTSLGIRIVPTTVSAIKPHDAQATLFASAARQLASVNYTIIEFDIGGKKSRRRYIRARDGKGQDLVIWVKSAHTWPGRADLLQFTWRKYEKLEAGHGHKAIEYACLSAQSRGASHILAIVGDPEAAAIHLARLYTLEEASEIAHKQSQLLGSSFYDINPACIVLQSFVPEFDDAARLSLTYGVDMQAVEELPAAQYAESARRVRTGRAYRRHTKVREEVMKLAAGICECCGQTGFLMDDGRHYLETHHIIEVAARGPDSTANVVAVCATCHRMAHFSADRISVERKMMQAIRRRECTDA